MSHNKLLRLIVTLGLLLASPPLAKRFSFAAPVAQSVQLSMEWSKCSEEYLYGGRATPFLGDVDSDGQADVLSAPDRTLRLFSSTGTEKWAFDLSEGHECMYPDWLNSSPLAVDLDGDGTKEVVVAATIYYSPSDPTCNPCISSCEDAEREGVIYVLNGRTGEEEWSYHTLPVYSSPAVSDLDGDGRLEIVIGYGGYAEGGAEGGVMALDARGNLLWKYEARNSVDSTPAIADLDGDGTKEIVFTSEDMKLYVVSSRGQGKWRTEPALALQNGACFGSITSSPAVGDLDGDGKKEIIVGNDCGGVFAYSWDGRKLWQYQNASASTLQFPSIKSSASVAPANNAEGKIFIGQGYSQSAPGFVIALDKDGNELRVYQTRGAVWSSPAIADVNADGEDEVLFTDYAGWLYVFSIDGDLLKEVQLSTGTWASPVVGDIDGDGRLEVVVSTGLDQTTPGQWCVEALEFGSSDVPHGSIPWGMFRQNMERTGYPLPPTAEPTPTPTSPPTATPLPTATPTPVVTPTTPTPENNVFSDVSDAHWAVDFINRLYRAGVTGGCALNPLRYCPDNPVTRAQMAVFLEKGMHYPNSYSPPDVKPTFPDTAGHWAEDWIEALKSDGITSGFPDGTYKPESPVTRAQMAVFLLKAKHGASYQPPAVDHSRFSDVPDGHWAKAWIEELAAEGITSGYPDGTYRPENPVSRAEMSVFLMRTFELP